MKVGELIKILEKFKEEDTICVSSDDFFVDDIISVEKDSEYDVIIRY